MTGYKNQCNGAFHKTRWRVQTLFKERSSSFRSILTQFQTKRRAQNSCEKISHHSDLWLDFWLVSDTLQEDLESVEIIPSIKSDHSAITLALNGIDDSKGGPSFWKFNSTLVNDNEYCQLLDGAFLFAFIQN